MIEKNLTNAQMELVYDQLAEALDATPSERRTLMLTKLSFTLANMVGEPERISQAIEAATMNLSASSSGA
jgi:hypothetical protein